jgi:hypothetical protein
VIVDRLHLLNRHGEEKESDGGPEGTENRPTDRAAALIPDRQLLPFIAAARVVTHGAEYPGVRGQR